MTAESSSEVGPSNSSHDASPPPSRRPSQLFIEFMSSRLGLAVFSLGTIVVVTHGTSVATAGIYIAAVGYAQLLFTFLDLGTGPNLIRDAVHGEHRHHIAVFVWTRAFLTACVLMVGALGVLVLFPADSQTAGFLSLVYVAASMYSVTAPVGQVLGTARVFRKLSLLQGATVFLGVSAVVLTVPSPSANLLVAAYSVGATISTVFGLYWVRRHMDQVPMASIPGEVAARLKAVMMLGVATGAGSLYLRIDQTLVLKLLGASEAAFYGLASRVAIQARAIPSSVQNSVSALMAHRLQHDGKLRDRESRVISGTALISGLGLSIVVIAVSDLAIYGLGGSKYSDAVAPTIIMGASLVSTSYNYVVSTSAVMSGKDRAYLIITLGVVTLNVSSNIVVIPTYGIAGAAVVAGVTELIAATANARLVGFGGGASSFHRFAAFLLASVFFAVAKFELMSLSLVVNALGSLLMVVLGAGLLKRSFSMLQTLPEYSAAGVVEDDVDDEQLVPLH